MLDYIRFEIDGLIIMVQLNIFLDTFIIFCQKGNIIKLKKKNQTIDSIGSIPPAAKDDPELGNYE